MEELNDVMKSKSQIGQKVLVDVMMRCTNEKTNPVGVAVERTTFNFFQDGDNGRYEYFKQEAIRNFMKALSAFYKIFPYGRFAHFTANSAIVEAIPSPRVESGHIVDFDSCEGSRWSVEIEAITQQRKSLTITSVKLEEHDLGFEDTKQNLFNIVQTFGHTLIVQEKGISQMVQQMDGRRKGRLYGL
ncbi:nodulation-signaling pathway 2 protein-like protein [Tanacetum coccineum]